MLCGNKEIWFWRFVGIFALAICTLNLMVLMKGMKMFIAFIFTNYAAVLVLKGRELLMQYA